MKFVRIEMLLLIWLIPLVLLVFWAGARRRARILSRFARGPALEAIQAQVNPGMRRLKAGLLIATLLFCVFALTGPQYGYRWQEIEQRGVDIMVAVDCSRSMLVQDVSPTRLDRAKRKIFDLLSILEGDRIGMTVFAGVAFLQCPLTLDYESVHLFMQNLSPDFIPIGGSDLAGVIDAAVGGFKKEDNTEKAVILITDGESTVGDPLEAARKAKEAGIKIFCLGVGDEKGAPIPDKEGGFVKDRSGGIVMSRLDEDILKRVAALTGGIYVRSVAGDTDLETIYQHGIRSGMESSVLSGGRKQIWEDRYQFVLILAVLALAVELFLRESRKIIAGFLVFLILGLAQPSDASPFRSDDLQKGMDAYEQGDYQTALDHFIRAQLNDPERSEIYYNIGNAYYKINDFENARRSYKKALDTEKTSLRQKVLYNLGNADFRKGEYKDAIENYEKVLKIDPQDQLAKANMEFVKKVMEQPPPPKQKSGQDQDKKEGVDPKEQKDDSGEKEEKSDKTSEDRPKAGQGQEDKEEKADEQQAAGQGEKEEKKDEQQSAAQAGEKEKEDKGQQPDQNMAQDGQQPDDAEMKQAERILNRLQDRPGAALIPQYRERSVERDW